jgi:hypothetical protein
MFAAPALSAFEYLVGDLVVEGLSARRLCKFSVTVAFSTAANFLRVFFDDLKDWPGNVAVLLAREASDSEPDKRCCVTAT